MLSLFTKSLLEQKIHMPIKKEEGNNPKLNRFSGGQIASISARQVGC